MTDELDVYIDSLVKRQKKSKLSPDEITSTLREAGWDEAHIPTMTAIAQAESSGDPWAHNPKHPDDSYGLWQINRLAHPEYSPDSLRDPISNAKAALDVFARKKQGFGAWSTYTSGAYKKFLKSQPQKDDLDTYIDSLSSKTTPAEEEAPKTQLDAQLREMEQVAGQAKKLSEPPPPQPQRVSRPAGYSAQQKKAIEELRQAWRVKSAEAAKNADPELKQKLLEDPEKATPEDVVKWAKSQGQKFNFSLQPAPAQRPFLQGKLRGDETLKEEARKRGINVDAIRRQVEAQAQQRRIPQPYSDQYGTRVRLSDVDLGRVEQEFQGQLSQQIAESDRQKRVGGTSTLDYLAQTGKSAALGGVDTVASFPKLIGILAKKADSALGLDNSYTRTEPFRDKDGNIVAQGRTKDASDYATYRIGEWASQGMRSLINSNPDLEQEFKVGQLPNAIGQGLTMIAGGRVLGASRLGIILTGGAMTAADAYEEVKRAGGTDDEATSLGLLAGAVLGPTELFGFRGALDVLEGTVQSFTLRSAAKLALKTGRKDVLENAIQEAVQEAGQGLITGQFRSLEDIGKAALLGAVSSGVTTPTVTLGKAALDNYISKSTPPVTTPEQTAPPESGAPPAVEEAERRSVRRQFDDIQRQEVRDEFDRINIRSEFDRIRQQPLASTPKEKEDFQQGEIPKAATQEGGAVAAPSSTLVIRDMSDLLNHISSLTPEQQYQYFKEYNEDPKIQEIDTTGTTEEINAARVERANRIFGTQEQVQPATAAPAPGTVPAITQQTLSPRSPTLQSPLSREQGAAPERTAPPTSMQIALAQALKERDYSDAEIARMTPEEAQEIVENEPPHHSVQQNRRQRNVATGKRGQFKKGKKVETASKVPKTDIEGTEWLEVSDEERQRIQQQLDTEMGSSKPNVSSITAGDIKEVIKDRNLNDYNESVQYTTPSGEVIKNKDALIIEHEDPKMRSTYVPHARYDEKAEVVYVNPVVAEGIAAASGANVENPNGFTIGPLPDKSKWTSWRRSVEPIMLQLGKGSFNNWRSRVLSGELPFEMSTPEDYAAGVKQAFDALESGLKKLGTGYSVRTAVITDDTTALEVTHVNSHEMIHRVAPISVKTYKRPAFGPWYRRVAREDGWRELGVNKGDTAGLVSETLAYGLTGHFSDETLQSNELQNALVAIIKDMRDAHGNMTVEELAKYATQYGKQVIEKAVGKGGTTPAQRPTEGEAVRGEPDQSPESLRQRGREGTEEGTGENTRTKFSRVVTRFIQSLESGGEDFLKGLKETSRHPGFVDPSITYVSYQLPYKEDYLLIRVSIRDGGRVLYIDGVGWRTDNWERRTEFGNEPFFQWHKIGPRAVIALRRKFKELYPNVEEIEYFRSGSTANKRSVRLRFSVDPKSVIQAERRLHFSKSKSGEKRVEGRDPQEVLDELTIKGWDLYISGKTEFDAWRDAMMKEFGYLHTKKGKYADEALPVVWDRLFHPVKDEIERPTESTPSRLSEAEKKEMLKSAKDYARTKEPPPVIPTLGGLQPEGEYRERRLPQRLEESGRRGGRNRVVRIVGDREAVEKAYSRLREEDPHALARELISAPEMTKNDFAEGIVLIDHFQEEGDIKTADDIASNLARKSSQVAQALQAHKLVQRLSPEGVLREANRDLQRNYKDPNRRLSKADAEKLVEQTRKAKELEDEALGLKEQEEEISPEVAEQALERLLEEHERLRDRLYRRAEEIEAGARARLQQRRAIIEMGTHKSVSANVKLEAPPPQGGPLTSADIERGRATRAQKRAEDKPTRRGPRLGERGSTPIFNDLADYIAIGTAKMMKGTINFADWSEAMVTEAGEDIRPYLSQIFRHSGKDYLQRKKQEKYKADVQRVTKGSPENFSADEIEELLKLEKQTRSRKARDRAELRRRATFNYPQQERPQREKTPKPLPPRPSAIGRKIAGLGQNEDPNIVIGALKQERAISRAQWEKEMADERGIDVRNREALKSLFTQSYELRQRALAELEIERAQRTGENISVDDAIQIIHERRVKTRDALKARREMQKTYDQLTRTRAQKGFELFLDTINIPKSVKTSLDFSAPGRQGWILLTGAPKKDIQLRAFQNQFENFYSKALFEENVQELNSHPRFAQADRNGLFIAEKGADDVLSSFTNREEAFLSKIAMKIPFVARSSRAYTGYLDWVRMGYYDMIASEFERRGMTEATHPTEYKALAEVINTFSGRGNLSKAASAAAPVLNALTWSPRFLKSRFQAINPIWYARLYRTSPETAKFAMRTMTRSLGTNLAILGLFGAAAAAGIAPGVSVNWTRPEDSDWLRVRINSTEFDISAGTQSVARYFYRMGNNTYQRFYKGRKDVDSPVQVTLDFLKNKAAPIPEFAIDLWRGKDFEGRKMSEKTVLDHIRTVFAPIITDDVREALRQDGWFGATLVTAASGFGFGTSTFPESGIRAIPKDARKELERLDFSSQEIFGQRSGITEADQFLSKKTEQLISQRIPSVISSGEYQQLSDARKALKLKGELMKIRAEAKTALRDSSPALFRKVVMEGLGRREQDLLSEMELSTTP